MERDCRGCMKYISCVDRYVRDGQWTTLSISIFALRGTDNDRERESENRSVLVGSEKVKR